MSRIVIVGGGHAAAQLCASLVDGKFSGQVTLVSAEAHVPYHRPPLSKALLKDEVAVLPELRAAAYYADAGIAMRLSTTVAAIDRAGKTLTLKGQGGAPDESLPYDHLVLATGAAPRLLPGVPQGAPGGFYLRTFDDTLALRAALPTVQHVVVLGGGFIGLEIAATLHALGKQVTVLEAAPRLLARSLSPEMASDLLQAHQANGLDVRLGQSVQEVLWDHVEGGRFTGVQLPTETLQADALLVGIGAEPCTALAVAAGLDCDNGVVVDTALCTSDPDISAIGDCAAFYYPLWQQAVRLESVQNANEQARAVAARLCGVPPKAYASMPWFWSDQGDLRLQVTGLWRPGYQSLRQPGSKPGSLSVLHSENGELRAIESLNAPVDHMAARKVLQKTIV
jgi:3-phenylpropionate/trans-cinnamate dioxygenase ferredoxin reductase subunit